MTTIHEFNKLHSSKKILFLGNALSDKIISFLDSNAAQLMESKDTSLLYED